MKTILILTGEANDSLALISCQAFGRMGLAAHAAGLETSGEVLKLSRHCRSYRAVAASRAQLEEAGDAVLARAVQAARDCGAQYVFAADVAGGYVAARMTGFKRLPGLPAAMLRTMDNKWTFYGFLKEHGLPTPRTWLIESAEQARDLPLPLVLKPLNLSASLGVCVVKTAAERDQRLGGGDKHLRLPVLAQEHVDGQDVDLSFLAKDGVLNAWTVQTRRPDGTIDYIEDERIVELGRRIAKASSYTGLSHIDMRYVGADRADVTVIECNPRAWDSLPMTAGLGVDYLGRALDMADGVVRPPVSGSPLGVCGNLRGIVRRLLTLGSLTVCEKAFFGGVLGDPLPVLVRAARRRFPGAA